MGVLDTRSYFPDCRFNELGDEDYFNKDKTFGHFADKGSAYVITTETLRVRGFSFCATTKS